MQVPNDHQPQEAATWTKKSILLLLSCLTKRKQDLRNSKIKKKDIWRQIKEEIIQNGYANFDENIIERKFRNMKNTHKTIKDNKKRSTTGRGEVKWEYYDAMEEIFINDKTINIGHTISSMPSTSKICTESSFIKTVPPQSASNFVQLMESEEKCKEIEVLEASDALSSPIASKTPSSSTQLSPSSSSVTEGTSSQNMNKAQRGRQLYGLRKQQLEIEASRIKELQVLREAIEENNRIQKERNELLKVYLEKNNN